MGSDALSQVPSKRRSDAADLPATHAQHSGVTNLSIGYDVIADIFGDSLVTIAEPPLQVCGQRASVARLHQQVSAVQRTAARHATPVKHRVPASQQAVSALLNNSSAQCERHQADMAVCLRDDLAQHGSSASQLEYRGKADEVIVNGVLPNPPDDVNGEDGDLAQSSQTACWSVQPSAPTKHSCGVSFSLLGRKQLLPRVFCESDSEDEGMEVSSPS